MGKKLLEMMGPQPVIPPRNWPTMVYARKKGETALGGVSSNIKS
jgi:hypothetical protein